MLVTIRRPGQGQGAEALNLRGTSQEPAVTPKSVLSRILSAAPGKCLPLSLPPAYPLSCQRNFWQTRTLFCCNRPPSQPFAWV